jgi:hypothetical protein
VPHIEASKHDAATAYVVFDNHRRGDWTTYVYRTSDYGRTWQPLAPGQVDGYVHVIEEDPVEPRLLFLGSEFGLYVSLDGGQTWQKWAHGGYPRGTSTRALVVHPRDHDLAIGTHGRGAWIIDDIRPLREMARDARIAANDLHLFEPPRAIQHTRGMTGPLYFPGDTEFHGENRPYGALISYWVSDALAQVADTLDAGEPAPGPGALGAAFNDASNSSQSGPAVIEVMQGDSVIRTFRGPAAHGVNRAVWELERNGIRPVDADEDDPHPAGPQVLPGTYGLRIAIGNREARGAIDVVTDPRRPATVAIVRANLDVFWRGQQKATELQVAMRRLDETRGTLDFYEQRLESWYEARPALRDSLIERTKDMRADVDTLLAHLRLPDTPGIPADTTLITRLGRAAGEASGTPYQPSAGRVQRLDGVIAEANALLARIAQFYASQVSAYRDALRAAGTG